MENQNESGDNQQDNELSDWSKEERFNLFEALQKHGSGNVTMLCKYIPTKSHNQIEMALEIYRKRSLSLSAPKGRRKRVNKPKSPMEALDSWAKLLTAVRDSDELRTDIATALRLIAEFEDKPPAECTEHLDFEKLYHTLADALDGKPLQDDSLIKSMIDKCFTDTALNNESSLRNAKFRELLGSISLTEKVVNSFPKPSDEPDLANLKPVIAERNYNPLNINEENCKLLG